jgi:hypothetical protein
MTATFLTPFETACKGGSLEASTDWPARRAWWRAESAAAGTYWAGILERLRQAVPSVDDEYSGLSPGFARACQEANAKVDREQINRRDIPLVARDGPASAQNMQRAYEAALACRRERYGLALSTRRAVNYLLQRGDAQALRNFVASHSPSEAQLIIAYAKERQPCP